MYVVLLLCCKVVGCSVFGVVGWGEGGSGKTAWSYVIKTREI